MMRATKIFALIFSIGALILLIATFIAALAGANYFLWIIGALSFIIIVGFVLWVLSIVEVAKNEQYGWLVVVIILFAFGSLIYLAFSKNKN